MPPTIITGAGRRHLGRTARYAAVVAVLLALGPVPSASAQAGPEVALDCGPEPTDMILEYGDLVHCAIDRLGDIDVFRFVGGSGHRIVLRITRRDEEVSCFRLFDPDGLVVGDFSCGRTASYALTQTGTYSVLVREGRGQGEYTLAVERVAPPSPAAIPINFNQIIDDVVDPTGDVDSFIFFGQAEDTVRIQIFSEDNDLACLEILDVERTLDGRCFQTLDHVLARTGTHTILVRDAIAALGPRAADYSLTLICIDGSCEGGNLRPLEVAGCLDIKGIPASNQAIRLTQPDERPKRGETDVRGCFAFDVVRGKSFDVEVVGNEVEQ